MAPPLPLTRIERTLPNKTSMCHLLCQITSIILLWSSHLLVSSCWSLQRQGNLGPLFTHQIEFFVVCLELRIGTFVSVILLNVSRSQWNCIFMSKDDQAMITLTGFDMWSLHYLSHLLAPVYEQSTSFMDADGFIIRKESLTRGWPWLMITADCLGLALA
jgi:hypothetical protein